MRRLLTGLCQLLLHLFFRRIEVVGTHHVPAGTSVVFALNHPSGLVDPLFVLCLSTRRVSFLAKAPLFSMPFIGTFVRAFECLPVYRSQDGADPQKNRKMMKDAAALLARGNAIALFPEATTHDDPALRKFRSGAARIALSARSLGKRPVHLVPGALYYEEKQTFRSRAVLAFGPALSVDEVELDTAGEPPFETARDLTSRLQDAVENLMPTARSAEELVLVEKAERLFSAALRDSREACPTAAEVARWPAHPSLADRMAARRQILEAYAALTKHHPDRVQSLVERLEQVDSLLEANGRAIDASPPRIRSSLRTRTLLSVLLLAPLALVGIPLHAPAYQAVRYFAFRYGKDEKAVSATAKLMAGLLFFPLTWALLVLALYASPARPLAAWVPVLGPVLGLCSLGFVDSWSALLYQRRRSMGKTDALGLKQVVAERAQIAEEMARLLKETELSSGVSR